MNDYGLVLGGGAARGAYQVGVLRFVFCDLAERLGRPTWPSLVSGTSVGAQNAVFAAAQSQIAIDRLAHLWRNLDVEQVYRFRLGNAISLLRSTLGSASDFALLDPTPFYELAAHRFPRGFLRRAIDTGRCHALIISATDVDTGYNTLFIDTADEALAFAPGPATRHERVRITVKHIYASGALPVVFPPVQVGGELYLDGGLRQNTPLRPLLRAGASRVLVVGVTQGRVRRTRTPGDPLTPNLPFLVGKTFNALMLDPVERDLEVARRMNEVLEWGTLRFGDAFSDGVREELGLQPVDIVYLKPSVDLGRLAAETIATHPPDASPHLRWLLHFIADRGNNVESDLLSYLYFDSAFTGKVEQLGWEDAKAREEELVQVLFGGG